MALRVAIIEDEPATARNLKFLLQELDPSIEVLVLLDSVAASVEWLGANGSQCDLLFMDIRLNDGLSLEIFEAVSVDAPVIFVTAYNDYALQAFKANGIDYVLKPIGEQELEQALLRFKRLTQREVRAEGSYVQLRQLAERIRGQGQPYKQSFLVHFRDKLIPLGVPDICWFQSANETTFARTADGRKLVVDFTLEQLQDQLDPELFFRVNRQFIVYRKAIREIDFYFNGRLLVKTNPESEDKMLISKARVPEFKAWMNA
jgi:two-component system, LytTR family, response regulator LytT